MTSFISTIETCSCFLSVLVSVKCQSNICVKSVLFRALDSLVVPDTIKLLSDLLWALDHVLTVLIQSIVHLYSVYSTRQTRPRTWRRSRSSTENWWGSWCPRRRTVVPWRLIKDALGTADLLEHLDWVQRTQWLLRAHYHGSLREGRWWRGTVARGIRPPTLI